MKKITEEEFDKKYFEEALKILHRKYKILENKFY